MVLTAKQSLAIDILEDTETNELIFGGGAGGGKSAFGCHWILKSALKYPGTRWLIGRSKLKTLKETTLKTFWEICNMQNLKSDTDFKYNSNEGIILFNNGSEILTKDLFFFPSDPNFDELGSLELTGAFVDECNQCVFKAWQILKSRIRFKLDENNLIPKMLGTCNPSKTWVYSEFYNLKKQNSLPNDKQFIQSLIGDNKFISKHYYKNLISLDHVSRERLLYGNWEYDDDPATLIDNDSILDYFNADHVQPEGQKYITIDVARKGKDKTIIRVWHGWLCIDRLEMSKCLLTESLSKIKILQAKHGVSNTNTIADEDGVGGGLVDFGGFKGFINNSRPLNSENFDNLKSQCSIKMAEKITLKEVGEVQNDVQVIQSTSEEMAQVKLKNIDRDGKLQIEPKEKVKERLGRSPDEWDSIMMRYFFELQPIIQGRARVFGGTIHN